MQDFETKRALNTALREHFELQRQIVDLLNRTEKQNRALLAIFGAAALEVGK